MTKCKYCSTYSRSDYGFCPQCGAPLAHKGNRYQKIVINDSYGGFSLSAKAVMRWAELSGIEMHCVVETDRYVSLNKPRHYREIDITKEAEPLFGTHFTTKPLNPDGTMVEDSYWYWGSQDKYQNEFRTNPNLIKVIEEMGKEANGAYSSLSIVEIPTDVEWVIQEYDGAEWVAEKHETWA